MSTVGGYHEYTRWYSVHWRNIRSTLGDTMSTLGDIMSTLGDTMSTPDGIQYTGEISGVL